MKIKIVTIGLTEMVSDNLGFIKPNILRSLNKLVLNVNSSSAQLTKHTLTMFFNFGGILVCAENPRGVIVGMATLIQPFKINGNTGRIEHVSVLPRYQKQGISGRMLSVLIDSARSSGLTRLDLTCDPKNKPANHLYERFGFKVRTNSWQRRLSLSK